MSIVLYEKFLDEVMPGMPGLIQAMAINAIRNATIEFCARSWVLNDQIDSISLRAGQVDYDLDPPSNGLVVHEIIKLYYHGKELIPGMPEGDVERSSIHGNPRRFYQDKPQVVSLFPVPELDEPGAITARVALKPSRTSSGIERYVFENYLEQIAYGAKGKLKAMANVPWGNPDQAIVDTARFNSACASVKLKVQRQFVRTRVRVKPQYF